MTKEITKAYILQEIEDKFKLRELTPETFRFSEEVVPIYNIGPHLSRGVIKYVQKNITSAGSMSFFAVPGTEAWVLNSYNVIFMGAGAFTVAGVYVTRAPNHADAMYLDLTAAQTVSYSNNLPKPVMLRSGDIIAINVDGFTSAQNLRLYIDVTKEDVR